jgi:hypothetical protein
VVAAAAPARLCLLGGTVTVARPLVGCISSGMSLHNIFVIEEEDGFLKNNLPQSL